MMKYLLLLIFLYVVWRVWSKRRPDLRQKEVPPAVPPVERMLVCEYCRVHFPEGDGVKLMGHAYCSVAHQEAANSAKQG